jgi:flagellar biosynthesis protein FliQ
MTPELIIQIGQQALFNLTILLLVMLVPALVTGVLISMFQAATQINEMTLSFIPKLLITLLVMVIAGPWMLSLIMEYTLKLFENIPSLIG